MFGITKKYQIENVESAVAKRPGRIPPYHEESITAGKKVRKGSLAPHNGVRNCRKIRARAVAAMANP